MISYGKGPDEEMDYCKCEHRSSLTIEDDGWGYWDVCCNCGKRIEDGYHYYNHYDGEDHDDVDIY